MRHYTSILRKLEYKKLASLNLRGNILDIGGSRQSAYHKLILREGVTITTLNIDPESKPEIRADVENPFPLEPETFDVVLALNLLEHVFNFRGVVKESLRVLKRGGKAVFVVPFLAAVHPSPEDYFRYTESALRKIFKEAGFDEISIEALGYGVMSARFMMLQNFLPPFLHPIFEKIAILEDLLLALASRALGKKYRKETYPLGYFVVAQKPN